MVAGYSCEAHNNPPDFFLDVINGDSTAIAATETHEPGKYSLICAIKQVWLTLA